MNKDIELLVKNAIENLSMIQKFIEAEKHGGNDSETLNFTLIKSQGQKRPIQGHRLSKYDEYTKKIYFVFLTYLATIDPRGLAEKYIFIQRLLSGVGFSSDIESVILQSKKIQLNDLSELSNSEISTEIADEFIVDVLIAANIIGTCNTDCIECISLVASILGLSVSKFKQLATLAKAILQNSDEEIFKNSEIDLNNFICYFNEKPEYTIYNNIDMLESSTDTKIMLLGLTFDHIQIEFRTNTIIINEKEYNIIDLEKVCFKNCTFTDCKYISNEYFKYISNEYGKTIKLHFENCIFNGCPKNGRDFLELYNSNIIDCQFYNWIAKNVNDDYAHNMICIDSSVMKNTAFTQCEYSTKIRSGGGHLIDAKKSDIMNCTFTKCSTHVRSRYNSVYSNIIQLSDGNINKCIFEKCINTSFAEGYGGSINDVIYCVNSRYKDLTFNDCNKDQKNPQNIREGDYAK